MTKQAKNSLILYLGGDPAIIERLLGMQSASVVNELKCHFSVDSNSELAICLAMGH